MNKLELGEFTLIYYNILDFQKESLKYLKSEFDVITLPDPSYDRIDLLKKANVIFAPMGFKFGKSKVDKSPNLQIIATPTTGIFHVDIDYAAKKNIHVCSLRDQQSFLATITPTAELAWGLVLAVTRRIPWAYDSVCKGKWEGQAFGKRTPRMLSEMSLGIVGLGRLGSIVAGYGESFQMDVLYYDPYVQNNQYTKCDDLYALAKASDIVSVHIHLSKETENLINREFMESMPQGSYIINTSRGGIVDENALLEMLISGHLAGAGLDMLAGEHLPGFKEKLKENPIVKYANTYDNLVLTPKMGGCTIDAWVRTERLVIDMIIQELKKRGKM